MEGVYVLHVLFDRDAVSNGLEADWVACGGWFESRSLAIIGSMRWGGSKLSKVFHVTRVVPLRSLLTWGLGARGSWEAGWVALWGACLG